MKETLEKQTSFICSKFRIKAFLGFGLGVALAIAGLGINAQKRVVYEVYVNDISIGYIRSIDEYEAVKSAIVQTDGTEPLQYIKLVASNEYWRKTSEGLRREENQSIARGDDIQDQTVIERKTIQQALAATRIKVKSSRENTNESDYTYDEYLQSKEENQYRKMMTASAAEEDTAVEAMAVQDNDQAAVLKKGYLTSSWIENYTREALNLRIHAVALCADGEQMAVLYNRDDADKVMEEVKKHYYPQYGVYEILSCAIKESIKTTDIMAYKEEIVDTYDAVQKIIDGKGIKKIYEVQSGDTVWDIALRNGVSIEEMEKANEDKDINNIHIGDELNLSVVEPYVNVTVVADVTSNEVIAYETQKINDSSLEAGTAVVKQEGQNGLAQVQAKVTLVNGNTVSEDVLDRTVITEPVNRILNIGTYYVASGTYQRPTSGMISSRYGSRWGGFHSGVDFASERGTSIRASNGGKVIMSSWNGAYGLCVMIDHGEGIQTLYGHCSDVYVSVGDYVSKGQTIAAVGSTGRSTGPHCHFEVRVYGNAVNPFNFIP